MIFLVRRLDKCDGPIFGELGGGGEEEAYVRGAYIRDANWVTCLGGVYWGREELIYGGTY